MLSRGLARVYERWWRPALGRLAKGLLGPSMAGELRIAVEALAPAPGDRVLDVACGTGAFTRAFAAEVGAEGLAVGVDVSETMLARAVAETARSPVSRRVALVRCDAERLPFRDAGFQGACCFAALNLIGDPWRALDEMTRALVPGGGIVLFTSARGRSTPMRTAEAAAGRLTGMRLFERWELVEGLEERGFGEIGQRVTGVTQFVSARLAG